MWWVRNLVTINHCSRLMTTSVICSTASQWHILFQWRFKLLWLSIVCDCSWLFCTIFYEEKVMISNIIHHFWQHRTSQKSDDISGLSVQIFFLTAHRSFQYLSHNALWEKWVRSGSMTLLVTFKSRKKFSSPYYLLSHTHTCSGEFLIFLVPCHRDLGPRLNSFSDSI